MIATIRSRVLRGRQGGPWRRIHIWLVHPDFDEGRCRDWLDRVLCRSRRARAACLRTSKDRQTLLSYQRKIAAVRQNDLDIHAAFCTGAGIASLQLFVDYKIQKLRTKATVRGIRIACLHWAPLGPLDTQVVNVAADMDAQGAVGIIQRTILGRICRQFVENESQRRNDSTIDEHFIAIDDEVFVSAPS